MQMKLKPCRAQLGEIDECAAEGLFDSGKNSPRVRYVMELEKIESLSSWQWMLAERLIEGARLACAN